MFGQMFLHLVYDPSRSIDIFLGAFDYQVSLTGCDLNAEALAHQTKMTIGRTEQLELLAG